MEKSKSVKVFLIIQLIGVLISLAGIARMDLIMEEATATIPVFGSFWVEPL